MITEAEIIKAATICPKCGGELEDFVDEAGFLHTNAYCPNCNIIKTTYETVICLCRDCHFPDFINYPGIVQREKDECWFCGGEMRWFSFTEFQQMQKDGTLKEGYHLFQEVGRKLEQIAKEKAKCKHVPEEKSILWKEGVRYVKCTLCGRKEFSRISLGFMAGR